MRQVQERAKAVAKASRQANRGRSNGSTGGTSDNELIGSSSAGTGADQHMVLLAALQAKQELTDRKVDGLQESLTEIKMLLKKEHWAYQSNHELEQQQVPHELGPKPRLGPEPEPELEPSESFNACQ